MVRGQLRWLVTFQVVWNWVYTYLAPGPLRSTAIAPYTVVSERLSRGQSAWNPILQKSARWSRTAKSDSWLQFHTYVNIRCNFSPERNKFHSILTCAFAFALFSGLWTSIHLSLLPWVLQIKSNCWWTNSINITPKSLRDALAMWFLEAASAVSTRSNATCRWFWLRKLDFTRALFASSPRSAFASRRELHQ